MSLKVTLTKLLFASVVFVLSAYSQGDVYQWKDEAERDYFSDRRSAAKANVYDASVTDATPASVKLDVPLVKQGKNLCGPATIEMLFRYWGVDEYDQYDIAYNLLLQFAKSRRVKRSGIMETNPMDWSLYPGTGTINMREFLKQFAGVENPKLEKHPVDEFLVKQERVSRFNAIKNNIANGVPVIVHQYWDKVGSKGHYRLVTGYDEKNQEVYLNDSASGEEITQSYERFFMLWNVNRTWLHYNALVFNKEKHTLKVDLISISGRKL